MHLLQRQDRNCNSPRLRNILFSSLDDSYISCLALCSFMPPSLTYKTLCRKLWKLDINLTLSSSFIFKHNFLNQWFMQIHLCKDTSNIQPDTLFRIWVKFNEFSVYFLQTVQSLVREEVIRNTFKVNPQRHHRKFMRLQSRFR